MSNDQPGSLNDWLQKGLYLGVGVVSSLPELVQGDRLRDLGEQATRMVESLVERGEMTTSEARQTLDELLRQAGVAPEGGSPPREPERPIEIRVEAVEPASPPPTPAQSDADLQSLRDEIARLRNELERLEGQDP